MLLFVQSGDFPGGTYSGVIFSMVSINQLLLLFPSMHSPLSQPSSPPLAVWGLILVPGSAIQRMSFSVDKQL